MENVSLLYTFSPLSFISIRSFVHFFSPFVCCCFYFVLYFFFIVSYTIHFELAYFIVWNSHTHTHWTKNVSACIVFFLAVRNGTHCLINFSLADRLKVFNVICSFQADFLFIPLFEQEFSRFGYGVKV